jgi:hypothetical protein
LQKALCKKVDQILHMSYYIYILIGFAAGFISAWIIQLIAIMKLKKENKSAKGLLESEKLIKENANKENNFLLQSADAALLTTRAKLKEAQSLIRLMDTDILLLQKSNEETEALLAKGEPAIHELKIKLIEANNVIARYKSITGEK